MSSNRLIDVEQMAIANHHVSFFGAFAQQNPRAFLSLNRLLLAHDFTTIIELGSHDFGLATFFALYAALSRIPAQALNPKEPSLYKNNTYHKHPKTFHTFDNVIRDLAGAQLMSGLGADFVQTDTLNDQKTIDAIRQLIQRSGTTLLLCDGGDKRKEVTLYAPALKSGDFIMVHDWAKDAVAAMSLRKKGIWDAHESWWAEDGPVDAMPREGIRTACEANGVQQIYSEEFDDAAWFCGRKAP